MHLELPDAAPAQLDSERDEPHRKHNAECPLRGDSGQVCSRESAENAADHELRQDGQIIVARAQLESAADQRKAEAKEQIGTHHAGGGERSEP